ncbi:flagellin lysine-N-methylase [uncultured Clostridium sp.]|uniref:flagellin lysine-N-methylase n=1 Tax=uncultured Clostridium sp. TaxID=59620 RepID=UPI0025F68D79|nr:flagellin lysine-N-methylase [uncultured Clostridium sp.]
MKLRTPDYFDEFKCIADKCEDTCCAGWGIVIDDKSYEKYLSIKGKFGEVLRSKIVQDEGENVFILNGDRCSFLNDNNLCEIYSELGGENLCYTCRQYPRYLEEFGNLREIGLSLSCPEAARIILSKSRIVNFKLSEIDEEVSVYNDINPNIYINLMQCRKIIFDILQDRKIELIDRLILALIFVNEIQEKIDSNDISFIKNIKDKYIKKEFIYEKLNSFNKYDNRIEEKYINIHNIINIFKDLKHLKDNDILGLENSLRYFWKDPEDINVYSELNLAFNTYYKKNEYKFEQIVIYYVYRYFMKSVFDYDALAKLKFALVSFIIIKELSIIRYLENKEFLDEDLVDIVYKYSRDIEHLEENIDILEELFETRDEFSVDNLIICLYN